MISRPFWQWMVLYDVRHESRIWDDISVYDSATGCKLSLFRTFFFFRNTSEQSSSRFLLIKKHVLINIKTIATDFYYFRMIFYINYDLIKFTTHRRQFHYNWTPFWGIVHAKFWYRSLQKKEKPCQCFCIEPILPCGAETELRPVWNQRFGLGRILQYGKSTQHTEIRYVKCVLNMQDGWQTHKLGFLGPETPWKAAVWQNENEMGRYH